MKDRPAKKRCPRCESEDTEPRADIAYNRECQRCFFVGPQDAFDPNAEPTYSWHVVNHDDVAWDVIEVRHYPSTLELRAVMLKRTEEAAKNVAKTLRIAAERQGRELAYP